MAALSSPRNHARQPVDLLLDELIICGAAAEPRREGLLEHGDQLVAEEEHAFAGQLLVAADRMQVPGQPGAADGAAAVAFGDHPVVAALGVEHQLRRARVQGGEVEGPDSASLRSPPAGRGAARRAGR